VHARAGAICSRCPGLDEAGFAPAATFRKVGYHAKGNGLAYIAAWGAQTSRDERDITQCIANTGAVEAKP